MDGKYIWTRSKLVIQLNHQKIKTTNKPITKKITCTQLEKAIPMLCRV